MRSIWLRARLDTAPRFCGLEIGNAVPHRRQRGIPKGGRTPSHTPRRPRPSASRADWRSGSRCKRSRTAFTSRSRCCEYRSVYTLTHRAPGARRSAGVEITRTSEPNGRNRNGQSARLGFRPQNYGAVGKTLLATTMMAEFSIFQWVLPLERGFLFAKRRSVAGRLPRRAAPLFPAHATARRAPTVRAAS